MKKVIIFLSVLAFISIIICGISVFAYIEKHKENPQKLLDLEQSYLKDGEYKQAIKVLESLLEIDARESKVESSESQANAQKEILAELAEVYLTWADDEVKNGNTNHARQILKKGSKKTEDKRIVERLSQLQDEKVDSKEYGKSESKDDPKELSSEIVDVLKGNTTFLNHAYLSDYYASFSEQQYISKVSSEEGYFYVPVSYAIVDMDNDGINEAVVLCETEGDGIYVVLHLDKKIVNGYMIGYRGMEHLQKNGLYWGSGGAAYGGVFQMKFNGAEAREIELASMDGDSCIIKGEAVSADGFGAELEKELGFSFQGDNDAEFRPLYQ